MLFNLFLLISLVAVAVRALPNVGIQRPLLEFGRSPAEQHQVPTKEGWIDPRINGGQFLDVCFLTSLPLLIVDYKFWFQ